MNNQKITVYIPTKNRCDLLQRAVRSVQTQTYTNFEIIIVNDGSSDGTLSYLKKLVKDDLRIRYFSNSISKGACFCRNLALKNSQSYFVTGLDDDDEFLPHRLSSLVENYDPKYAFICSGFYWDYGKYRKMVNRQPKIFSITDILNYNEASNQVLVERERLLEIGRFDEGFVACQDYDVWTRLITKYGNAQRISQISYIVHRDKNLERITKPSNWLEGHKQFMKKHQSLMTDINMVNQQFKIIMVNNERLGLCLFLKIANKGLLFMKFRYFIISNVRTIMHLNSG